MKTAQAIWSERRSSKPGEGQHLAPGLATQRCEHHGTANQEKYCFAGDGEFGRIPPGEGEGEGLCDAQDEAHRAGVVERHRVAANPPSMPHQRRSGESDEAECPAGKARCDLAVDHTADASKLRPDAGLSAGESDVLAIPLLPLL